MCGILGKCYAMLIGFPTESCPAVNLSLTGIQREFYFIGRPRKIFTGKCAAEQA